ncbi:hypothetical protein [Cytophaga sp. FL35]|uniref:hypothetical protein n=1 Tax=Cytophaga sp. FL35 TaxID=1904456 RepID=UPI0016536F6D|nr:hypothetical protein [Cytophaga sp. FL35]MBC7000115.1 hypothetical protein [Cytophaga sp. FL35]
MTQIENYKKILEDIFKQKIKFSNNNIENNCIGALKSKDDYSVFRNNFIERLKRINAYFSDSEDTITEVINTAKQLGQTKGYKWAGAYSELVALDYWIQFQDLSNITFPDRGNVDDFVESIAKQIGQQEIDLDISLDLSTKKIYTDVKCLIPTHTELTDQILNRVKSKTRRQDYLIGIDDIYDVDFLRTKGDFVSELQSGNLINELEKCVNQGNKYYSHTLKSGNKASFRISYSQPGKNTVLTTTRAMDPYKLAIDYRYKILDYYNKLLINEPSLITFVINPWFNQELNTSLGDFFGTFLRSLARRVFMELTKDDTDMEIIFPDLIGHNLKISDVAKKITGIIFIKDNSIMKMGEDINDVYIYLNPNATNKVLKSSDFNILNWSPPIKQPFIDDFQNDNY